MGKPIHHLLDVFETELHVAYDAKAWERLRRNAKGLPKAAGLGWGLTHHDERNGVEHLSIWVDVGRHANDLSLLNTIVHEATHAAAFICKSHGISHDASETESIAWLTAWIAEWLWKNQP